MGAAESAAEVLEWPSGELTGHQPEWTRSFVRASIVAGQLRPCFPASDVSEW